MPSNEEFAIVCDRVVEGEAVLYCTRDEPAEDGDSGWQFLCGNDHSTGAEEAHLVRLSELVEARDELRDIAELAVGAVLERGSDIHAWQRVDLEESAEGSFSCAACGEEHGELPMDFGIDHPASYYDTEEFPTDRWKIDPDYATYGEGEHHFVRGVLEIPVLDGPGPFCYGIWVSASDKSFRAIRTTELPDEHTLGGPFFGWVQSELPFYPSVLGLKAHTWARGGNLRPLIQLEPTGHPLAVEHRCGITMARVHELVARMTGDEND